MKKIMAVVLMLLVATVANVALAQAEDGCKGAKFFTKTYEKTKVKEKREVALMTNYVFLEKMLIKGGWTEKSAAEDEIDISICGSNVVKTGDMEPMYLAHVYIGSVWLSDGGEEVIDIAKHLLVIMCEKSNREVESWHTKLVRPKPDSNEINQADILLQCIK